MRRQIVALAGTVLLSMGLAAGYAWYTHDEWAAGEPTPDFHLAKLLAAIRLATQRYLDVEHARADGYMQTSGNVPLQGYRFHNPAIARLDYTRPSTLFYIRADGQWHLVGLAYAVPGQRPAEPLFPGVGWRRQGALCRYADWQEFPARSPAGCPRHHPDTGSPFLTWSPAQWEVHLWLWYPNPSGLFAGLNPLLAPFDDRTIPPAQAGSWAEWRAHAAFSTVNHHVSGWLVLLMGVVMAITHVWGEGRRSRLHGFWALPPLALAAFILYRSDPEYWPFGVQSWAAMPGDWETIEHKLSDLIILAIGLVEWLRRRGALAHRAWGLLFPWLAIMGGTILLFHLHPVSNFNYLGRSNLPHLTEGITAILAGVTYLVGEWKLVRPRWWRLVPVLFVLLMGAQLILYVE
jgi:hypothetical protein